MQIKQLRKLVKNKKNIDLNLTTRKEEIYPDAVIMKIKPQMSNKTKRNQRNKYKSGLLKRKIEKDSEVLRAELSR